MTTTENTKAIIKNFKHRIIRYIKKKENIKGPTLYDTYCTINILEVYSRTFWKEKIRNLSCEK